MKEPHYGGLLDRFNAARVLVVGDVYLDENVFGALTGISLEAPVAVYEVQERRYNPGAAGNAACNMAALGAKTYIVGVVGNDNNADILRREFAARNVDTSGLVVDPAHPTNTYGKLRAGTFKSTTQEVLRTDTPQPMFIQSEIEEQVIANIRALAPKVDAIVVVDQVSSVATERVLKEVIACAKEHTLLTVGDSRERVGALKNFDAIVPNDREAGLGAAMEVVDDVSLHKAGKALLKLCKNAVVTRGSEGITIFPEKGSITYVPATVSPNEVVDVTGAGDTATAAVTLALIAGGSLNDAAVIGNTAAGIAVKKPGVITVRREELQQVLCEESGPGKVKTLAELRTIVGRLKKQGKMLVWTNGCFDILHTGHITYLMKAAQAGDVLIVGLNTDASVRLLKGSNRPIVSEKDRALVLSALECVDYIIIFSDETTVPILQDLQPDVYAKGGDYTVDTVNQEERHLVEGYGGRIHIVPGVKGRSTSAIIDKIIQENWK